MTNIINIIILLFSIFFIKDPCLQLCVVGPTFYYLSNNKKIFYILVLITSVLIQIILYKYMNYYLITITLVSLINVIVKNKYFKSLCFISIFLIILLYILKSIENFENQFNYIIFLSAYSLVVFICLKFEYKIIIELIFAIFVLLNSFEINIFKINYTILFFIYYIYYFSFQDKKYSKIIILLFLILYNYFVTEINQINYLLFLGLLSFFPFFSSYIISIISIFVGYLFLKFDDQYFISYILSFYIILVSYFINDKTKSIKTVSSKIDYSEGVSNKIISISQVINNIEDEFCDDSNYISKVNQIIYNTYESICINCNFCKECSYYINKSIYTHLRKSIEEETLKENRCLNQDNLNKKIYKLKSSYSLNLTNKKDYKLLNNLNNLSSILNQVAIEIVKSDSINLVSLNDLKENLEFNKIEVTYINMDMIEENNFQISICLKNCLFNTLSSHIEKNNIKYNNLEIKPILISEDNNRLNVKIVPKSKLNINFGYGLLSSNISNICGDNYLAKVYNDTKFAAIICDGMGKGFNAYSSSSKIIKVVDSLVEKNLDVEITLNLINIIYNTITVNEVFSSLDFLEINRLNGEGIFYKLGAASSILMNENGDINYIDNNNLPVGANNIITPIRVNLKSGDLILMASDGIYDTLIDKDEIKLLIKSMFNEDPQKIVYTIINSVRKKYKDIKDDISIIVMKISENN